MNILCIYKGVALTDYTGHGIFLMTYAWYKVTFILLFQILFFIFLCLMNNSLYNLRHLIFSKAFKNITTQKGFSEKLIY